MKAKNYINGLAALLLCTACNNEELPQQDSQSDEIAFGAMLQTPTAIETRGIGNNSGQTEALPYIYGIHVRKMESPTPLNSNYKVKNGNKGTLEVENATALKWTETEKANNTEIHFYAWTEPEGVTISDDAATGTINFGDTSGNRAPHAQNEDNKHKMNNIYYTPLELFISAHTTGSYKDNPTISLPFTHQVAKVAIQIYNWNNERISDNTDTDVKILFPFIMQEWNIEQKQTEGENAFRITTPCNETSNSLELTMNKLYKVENRRIFYLPPMVDNYDFTHAGDFVITYENDKYYGTLNDLALTDKSLKAGEYMKCRIDLNRNYGTGVGATIQDWKYAEETEAQANPYRGIYTTKGLETLKSYLESTVVNKELSDSLYIEEGGKKIIRLYNDLTLSDEDWSLKLEDDMIFDGLGHIVNVPSGQSLFGEVSATEAEDKKIAINNIRLAGAGQLAASLQNVSVYNCHANGTANLVGTAKGTTEFNFCSAENSTGSSTGSSITLMGSIDGSGVIVKNSFVASSATSFASSGTIIVQNSFIISTSANNNTYWSTAASGDSRTQFTIDPNNVTATTVTISSTTTKLIDLLNAGSKDTGNQWVYVYSKNYPVMRIK